MFESCGEVLTSGEMSVVYSNTTTTTRSESLTSYPSATNETHETNAQQLPFNLDHHSQCLTVPKVTFSSLGSFANKLVYTPLEQSDNGSSDNTSVDDKQNSHCEVKMSRFMNLARKFNCFYFNGTFVSTSPAPSTLSCSSFIFYLFRRAPVLQALLNCWQASRLDKTQCFRSSSSAPWGILSRSCIGECIDAPASDDLWRKECEDTQYTLSMEGQISLSHSERMEERGTSDDSKTDAINFFL